jgi:hypothetical protein
MTIGPESTKRLTIIISSLRQTAWLSQRAWLST